MAESFQRVPEPVATRTPHPSQVLLPCFLLPSSHHSVSSGTPLGILSLADQSTAVLGPLTYPANSFGLFFSSSPASL